jgi:hypothetical protein
MCKEILSSTINLQRNEVNHPHSYSAEVKNEWSSISIVILPRPAWGQLSFTVNKKICYKINMDRRYAEEDTIAALTQYVPYYHTAHVTEWRTRAVRLVVQATKLYRWRLILQNNCCSLFLTRKELCRSAPNEKAVPDYSEV